MIADGKEVPINPKEVVEFRKKIEAEGIALFTDIQVKYAKMIDTKKTMTDSAKEALSKGSNGVIVSGLKSGNPPSADRVHSAKKGAPKHDVIIGSGFSYENANDLLKHADGVIVGTSISVKTGGPLVPEKVKKLMDVVNNYRKNNL
jgi:predicted TIM-barrel enzyme